MLKSQQFKGLILVIKIESLYLHFLVFGFITVNNQELGMQFLSLQSKLT